MNIIVNEIVMDLNNGEELEKLMQAEAESFEDLEDYEGPFEDSDETDNPSKYPQWSLDSDIPDPTRYEGTIPKTPSDLKKNLLSISDFEEMEMGLALLRKNGYQFLFRGHAGQGFVLSPTIVRKRVLNYGQEKELLGSFKAICKSNGYEEWRYPSFNENLYYLGIGRHLGFYSRLLDWTASLWVALSFLMEDKKDFRKNDGVLWILVCPEKDLNPKNEDPFLIKDDKVHLLREDYYYSNAVVNIPLGILRRKHQNGYFSVVSEELLDAPFEILAKNTGYELLKIIVPKETKALMDGCQRIHPLDWLYGMADEEEPIVKKVEQLNQQFELKE